MARMDVDYIGEKKTMTEFCHITPIKHLPLVKDRNFHLTLAHLIEESDEYADFYLNRPKGQVNIMDNSAFEMYKQDRPMYDSWKLVDLAKRVRANYIIMSDYPDQHSSVTQSAAIRLAPVIKGEGFKTFYCPQSKIGDIDNLLQAFDWAASSELVDYIGVSILSVPNAYGVEKDNKLQRYMSRWTFMKELDRAGILTKIAINKKKMHFLGMLDGPREIDLVAEYKFWINTWDSSAAVWAGLNGIAFDNSPTGLINGKFEKEVDFYHESVDNVNIAKENMLLIDQLCFDAI
jgi:hypothetical protein